MLEVVVLLVYWLVLLYFVAVAIISYTSNANFVHMLIVRFGSSQFHRVATYVVYDTCVPINIST